MEINKQSGLTLAVVSTMALGGAGIAGAATHQKSAHRATSSTAGNQGESGLTGAP